MEGLVGNDARFIGIIERLAEGWRASFRLRVPNEVFTQQGDAQIFATELQATKWLHTQATARGFSSIEIKRQTSPYARHVRYGSMADIGAVGCVSPLCAKS